MGKTKGIIDNACVLRINKEGNFDLITPDGEMIESIIDVNIEQELDYARNGVAIATIRLYVKPDNGTN